jgi:hypothetical protein
MDKDERDELLESFGKTFLEEGRQEEFVADVLSRFLAPPSLPDLPVEFPVYAPEDRTTT